MLHLPHVIWKSGFLNLSAIPSGSLISKVERFKEYTGLSHKNRDGMKNKKKRGRGGAFHTGCGCLSHTWGAMKKNNQTLA